MNDGMEGGVTNASYSLHFLSLVFPVEDTETLPLHYVDLLTALLAAIDPLRSGIKILLIGLLSGCIWILTVNRPDI